MIFSFASNSTADYNCLLEKIHTKRLFIGLAGKLAG